MSLREQIRLLIELQRYDSHLQESDLKLQEIPRKLDALKADLARLEAMVQGEREELEGHERFRREQQTMLENEEENVVKAKAKLQQAKTGREHMAAQREIENNRKAAAERQGEINKLSQAIETGHTRLESHEKDVEDLRGVVTSEEAAAAERIAEIHAETGEERKARGEAARAVDPSIAAKYEHLRGRRTPAVTPVGPAGGCSGCHMAIPPQLFNILHRLESIETCPSCYRILYLSAEFPEAEEAQAAVNETGAEAAAADQATEDAGGADADQAAPAS